MNLLIRHWVFNLPQFHDKTCVSISLTFVLTCCHHQWHAQVILTWTDDATDPQFAISTQALRILEAARDAKGRRLTVHKLHQPDPVVRKS